MCGQYKGHSQRIFVDSFRWLGRQLRLLGSLRFSSHSSNQLVSELNNLLCVHHFIHSICHYRCKTKGKSLTAPKDYKTDNFFWEEYLSETDTVAVPTRAFKTRPANNWKTGMKLEVVDVRNPRMVRVATVSGRTNHVIRIHFDGWDEKYDYWVYLRPV